MSQSNTVILVTSNGLGKAYPELQQELAKKYFTLLADHDPLPSAICFYTEGVKLTVEGSPVLDVLRALEEKGVRLIVCSTCLNAFGLMEKLAVGIAGGMPDIIEAQMSAEKVITL